jgi:hypothetical protein
MALKNKCLAQSNKSHTRDYVINKLKISGALIHLNDARFRKAH